MGSPGVAMDKAFNENEYRGMTSGYYRTVEITVDADKDLIALYPNERCDMVANVGTADGVLKYTEQNDAGQTKTLILGSGQPSGMIPRVATLLVSGTTPTSTFAAKLYMHKIK